MKFQDQHKIFSNQAPHLLALLQRLIEAVAQGQVRLSLGALDKALNLPGTGASLVLLLLLLTILRLLLILLRGLLILLRWLLRTATPSLQDQRCD